MERMVVKLCRILTQLRGLLLANSPRLSLPHRAVESLSASHTHWLNEQHFSFLKQLCLFKKLIK